MDMKTLMPWRKKENTAEQQGIGFSNFHEDFEDLMDEMSAGFLSKPFRFKNEKPLFNPRLDVVEKKKAYEVAVELPGLDESDIDLSVYNGILTIRGEKKYEEEDNTDRIFHRECRYGSFSRTLQMPENIDADQINARFKKGVLKITLPKIHNTQRIKVKAA